MLPLRPLGRGPGGQAAGARPAMARMNRQAAIGVIVTGSFLCSAGSGIPDLDDPILGLGLDLRGVDAGGDRHRAREGPVAPLAVQVVLPALLLALLVLARDRQDPVLDLNL
jgi:hypothetical protein